MSLTVSHDCWLSLSVPVSCCMSLTLSHGCWLSLSLSSRELLHVCYPLPWLLAVFHCLSQSQGVAACLCLQRLLAVSLSFSQSQGVAACLSVFKGCWLSPTSKVGSICTCMLHTWDVPVQYRTLAYLLAPAGSTGGIIFTQKLYLIVFH